MEQTTDFQFSSGIDWLDPFSEIRTIPTGWVDLSSSDSHANSMYECEKTPNISELGNNATEAFL